MGGYNGLPRKKSLLFPRRRGRTRGQILDLTPMGPAADSKTVKRNRSGACSFEQRPFENSIRLVAIRSDRFQKTIDHEIVFKCHAQFTGDPALDHCFFYHAQHQHLGDSGAPILLDHAKSDQSPLSNPSLVEEQFDQTNRKPKSSQPPAEITQENIDVGQTQSEPDRLSPDLSDPGKLRHQQRLQFFGHKLDLRFCKWHKTPVLFPRLIVNLTESPALVPKIFEIGWANSDRRLPVNASREPPQMRHGF